MEMVEESGAYSYSERLEPSQASKVTRDKDDKECLCVLYLDDDVKQTAPHCEEDNVSDARCDSSCTRHDVSLITCNFPPDTSTNLCSKTCLTTRTRTLQSSTVGMQAIRLREFSLSYCGAVRHGSAFNSLPEYCTGFTVW